MNDEWWRDVCLTDTREGGKEVGREGGREACATDDDRRERGAGKHRKEKREGGREGGRGGRVP